jgi:uncharacterized protein
MDVFDWNDNKCALNIEKHGIDFEDAISVFTGLTIESIDDRLDYGEDRVIALGNMNGIVIVVVYTMRGDVCRIISARKANAHERSKYYAALRERPPTRED